jgi:outer membrane protein OmpA-like peptidoglycan-associated protein
MWFMSASSPIACQLDHVIPAFGVASFESKASRHINLDFVLDMQMVSANTHPVVVRSVPPPWRPGQSAQMIKQLNFFQQFDGYVSDQSAWRMLSELEVGNFPTFYFESWYGEGRATAVGLSSINFRDKYQSFRQCVSRLLPYSFDDISFTVLNYQSNSDQLTPRSKKRLRMIGEYAKYDPNIDMIVIDAYTDSYGGRWTNQELSERRARAIKEFFVVSGIDATKVVVEGHGEKRHIASNETTIGRQKNRRVVISLGKDLI